MSVSIKIIPYKIYVMNYNRSVNVSGPMTEPVASRDMSDVCQVEFSIYRLTITAMTNSHQQLTSV